MWFRHLVNGSYCHGHSGNNPNPLPLFLPWLPSFLSKFLSSFLPWFLPSSIRNRFKPFLSISDSLNWLDSRKVKGRELRNQGLRKLYLLPDDLVIENVDGRTYLHGWFGRETKIQRELSTSRTQTERERERTATVTSFCSSITFRLEEETDR